MLEEAEKRDHRTLGTRARPVPHRRTRRRAWCSGTRRAGRSGSSVEQYMRTVYQRQRLPGGARPADPRPLAVGADRATGTTTRTNMFTTESEKRDYALKPMNCPGHMQIFNTGLRELPRPAAALRRVRRLPPQRALRRRCTASCACAASPRTTATSSAPRSRSSPSALAFTALLQKVYADFGFTRHHLQGRHAARQAHRLRRGLGQGRARARSESCRPSGVRLRVTPGEGAFYGPKIEYSLKDAIGRVVAVRHHAGRLQHAGAPGRRIRGDVDNTRKHAGHAAPRHRRHRWSASSAS